MAFQRRRHPFYRRLRLLIPVISAIAAVLLLLFALLSFLAPSPIDTDRLHHSRPHFSFNVEVDDAIGVPVFHVPTGGRMLDRDVWSSINSEFFYGCSNASNKFPKAQVTTQPNRYLMIATSGGLNQQRTGMQDLEQLK